MDNQEQKRLDEMYRKEQHFFYNRVKETLSNVGNPFRILDSIQTKINEKRDLTEHEYEVIGSYSYLFGLDFSSMLFYNKNMQEKLKARLSDYTDELDEDFIKKIIDIAAVIKNENIVNAKDSMTNKIQKEINISSYDLNKEIMEPYRKLFDNVQIDIKYAYDCVELYKKDKITYNDLLKINVSVNETFKYVGYKAMNAFRNLFKSQVFVENLQKAGKIFDDVKFGTMYYDCILTLNEKVSTYENKQELVDFICGKFTDEDYKRFEDEYKAKQAERKENEQEEAETINKNKPLLDDEIGKKLMQDNPVQFLIYFVEDSFYQSNKEKLDSSYERAKDFTVDQFFEGYNNIAKDDDSFLRDFYSWLKGSKNYIKPDQVVGDPFVNINVEDLLKETKSIIEKKNEEYKEKAKNICRDIPEPELNKIKQMFDNIISGLILETEQQKQYIMSNFFENQIKTYQNLVQLLQLVESCNIKGSHAKYYKEISDYVKNLPFDFDITIGIDKLFKEISVYNGLKEFLEDYINKTTNKEENPAQNSK